MKDRTFDTKRFQHKGKLLAWATKYRDNITIVSTHILYDRGIDQQYFVVDFWRD